MTPPADYPFEVEIELTSTKQTDRVRELQEEIATSKIGYTSANLKAFDLILLLQHDPWVQQLVGQIASCALGLPLLQAKEDTESPVSTPQPNPKAEFARQQEAPAYTAIKASALPPRPAPWSPTPPQPEDTWRKELHEPLALLQCVRQDPELSGLWLGTAGQAESEPRQLLRVCVMAAQWDQVVQLAELLKTRCSQRQQAASANEMALLRGALALFNLSAGALQAGLQTPAVGENFDPNRHNRANSQGASIAECLLPALLNRSKKVVQAAVVLTR